MTGNEPVANNEEKTKMSWTGFMVGLVAGAVLFYITIQIISALMFSRTAA